MHIANAFASLLEQKCNRKGEAFGQLAVSVRTHRSVPAALVESIVVILEHMVLCTVSDAQQLQHQPSWDYRWKSVSHAGYDMYQKRWVDYNNWTYRTLLIGLCNADDNIAKLVYVLATYWPSLDPSLPAPSKTAIEMQGDLIEVILAALRGDANFIGVLTPLLPRFNKTLPQLFQDIVSLCMALHQVQGQMVTGEVAYKSARVQILKFRLDDAKWSPVWASFVDMLALNGDDVGLASLIRLC